MKYAALMETCEGWNQFWFSGRARSYLVPVRVAVCSVAAIWFGSFVADVDAWFGTPGVLSPSLAGQMIAFDELPAWQYWSPLWFVDSALACKLWLWAGMALGIAGISGWGGRITLGILGLWIIAWAHRIVWLAGPTEPALVAMVGYLVLEPGPTLRQCFSAADNLKLSRAWTAGCALRLIQTHWWILIAAGVVTQLADVTWWRGEAVWWLASAGRSTLLTSERLTDNALIVNGLTHAIVATQMLSLWLVTTQNVRWFGVCFGLVACLAIGLIADQQIYAALLASCLLSYRSPRT